MIGYFLVPGGYPLGAGRKASAGRSGDREACLLVGPRRETMATWLRTGARVPPPTVRYSSR